MSKKVFIRTCVVFWIIGALLDVPMNLFPSIANRILMIFVPIFAIFGGIIMYLLQRKEVGILGFIAFALGTMTKAYLPVAHSVMGMVFPYVEPEVMGALMTGPIGQALYANMYLFILGVVLLGFTTFFAKVFPRIPAILLILAYLPLAFGPAVPTVAVQIGTALGEIGSIWLAIAAWKMAEEREEIY